MSAQILELPRLYDRIAEVEESVITLREKNEKQQGQILEAVRTCTNAINETRRVVSENEHRVTVELAAIAKALNARVSHVDADVQIEIVKLKLELDLERARNVSQSKAIDVLRAAVPASNVLIALVIAVVTGLFQLWRH